jgi:UDP-N-acetylmuramoylalanine--D-glutamate ligase
METVAVLNDITYINNSVSTTINSTWYAFEETKGPTIWMAGGASAPNDYSIVLKHVKKRVRAIICIGIDNTRIQEYFYGRVDFIISAPIMEDAVNYARLIANPVRQPVKPVAAFCFIVILVGPLNWYSP